MTPRIYCWVNAGRGTDMQMVVAMAEDGTGLAGHLSSHEDWAKHDIGVTSDWKHEVYREHYPDGFEVVWVDNFHQRMQTDMRFAQAVALNRVQGERAKAAATSPAREEAS